VKKCYKCGKIKNLQEFYIDNRVKRDGHSNQCKECVKKYELERRIKFNRNSNIKEKLCSRCGIIKNISEFSHSDKCIKTYCKPCNAVKAIELRNKHYDIYLNRERLRRINRSVEKIERQSGQRINWQQTNKWNQRLCTKLRKEYGLTLRTATEKVLKIMAVERLLVLIIQETISREEAKNYYHKLMENPLKTTKEIYNYNTSRGISAYVYSNHSKQYKRN
jgi:hypothetical protein